MRIGGLLLLEWELGSRAGVRCACIRDIMGQGFFWCNSAVRSERRAIYLSATERCRQCLGMFCEVHGLQAGPLVAVYTLFIIRSVCRMHNCIDRLCISSSGPIEITVSQTPALPFLHCTGPNVPLKLTKIVCGRMASRTTSFVEMRKCIWILKLPKRLYLNRPRYFEEACLSFLRVIIVTLLIHAMFLQWFFFFLRKCFYAQYRIILSLIAAP